MYINKLINKTVLLILFQVLMTSSLIAATEDKFNNIKDDVIESTKKISDFKAKDAYEMIHSTLKDFQNIYQQVKNSKNIDDIIDEVTDGLINISDTYSKVAEFSVSIAKFRSKHIQKLNDAQGETLLTIQQLNDKKLILIGKNKELNSELEYATKEIDKQKIQISLKGNKSIIKSIEAQKLIWLKFNNAQTKLQNKLNSNGDKFELLLHILKVNAKVYKEAANVAMLRKSAKAALQSLTSLSDIQDILNDLENSWIEVNDLVAEISNAEFKIE